MLPPEPAYKGHPQGKALVKVVKHDFEEEERIVDKRSAHARKKLPVLDGAA